MHLERGDDGFVTRVCVAANTGEGLHLLLEAIAERLNAFKVHKRIILPVNAGRLRSQLYSLGAVIDETPLETGGWAIEIALGSARWATLMENVEFELDTSDVVHESDGRNVGKIRSNTALVETIRS